MVLKLRCNSRTTIVNKLTSIPPTRAQSTMLHVLEFSLVCSCFFKDPKAIPFSTFLCIWFFLFLNNHPIRFLLFRLSSSTSFCPPQLSGPQSQGSDSFEHAQVTNGSEQGEHFSWPGIFLLETVFSSIWLRAWITSPKTDHLPTDVILTIAEVPSMLSGATTSTWMYAFVWPTFANKE